MSKLLYNKTSILSRLYRYFSIYFKEYSTPTIESFFLLLLSMLVLESADSLRFLYRHFISQWTEKSLNAFYYLCSYAKVDYSSFMNTTVKIALSLIPISLRSQPVLLCIDDTMVAKYGTKFEEVSKLFDHAAHQGSSYLHGHCFVSLLLCIPVWKNGKIHYLSLPLGYRMWQKTTSKLALAAQMVTQVMPQLQSKRTILLCDSWYAKQEVTTLVEQFEHLDIVCNVRKDTVLYELPPKPSGKRGRPKKYGERLSLENISLSEQRIGGYYTGVQMVLSNLFGERRIFAYVTSTESIGGSRRLFLSTITPVTLSLFCAWQEVEPLNQTGLDWMMYVPLFLYRFRWNIEVSYYEQKKFWSLERYMLRSRIGIERMINLITILYSAMKLLPYLETDFSEYQTESVQDFRWYLSKRIREQLIIQSFVKTLETQIKSSSIRQLLQQKALSFFSHTQKL